MNFKQFLTLSLPEADLQRARDLLVRKSENSTRVTCEIWH